MSQHTQKITLISVLLVPLFFSGIFAGLSPCKEKAPAPVTLEFWSVYDDSDVYAPLIADFQKLYPYITINYHKKNYDTYEQDLIGALAAGRGPDIFSIHNTWLSRYLDKLSPAPQTMITSQKFGEIFVEAASNDFVLNQKIYAFPFSVDSLALFYNKDLLNSAGVAQPPQTWEEFNAAVEVLTKKEITGEISQAGAALGTSRNINRSTDILAALMIQSGAKMVSEDKTRAAFDQAIILDKETFYPARQALTFYINFANPQKKVYTWNNLQHYSLDAFSEGKVALMLSYSYQIPVLRAKAPHLNFGVAALPQISKNSPSVSFANYWGQAVAKNSANALTAWQFLGWLASPENLKKYLAETRKPTARRDLIDWQRNDPEIGVFAVQTLAAKSWWQADNSAVEKIFADMIDEALDNPSFVDDIIEAASQKVSLMMNKIGE